MPKEKKRNNIRVVWIAANGEEDVLKLLKAVIVKKIKSALSTDR